MPQQKHERQAGGVALPQRAQELGGLPHAPCLSQVSGAGGRGAVPRVRRRAVMLRRWPVTSSPAFPYSPLPRPAASCHPHTPDPPSHLEKPFHTSGAKGQRSVMGRSACMAAVKSRWPNAASKHSRRSASFFHLSFHLHGWGRQEGGRQQLGSHALSREARGAGPPPRAACRLGCAGLTACRTHPGRLAAAPGPRGTAAPPAAPAGWEQGQD